MPFTHAIRPRLLVAALLTCALLAGLRAPSSASDASDVRATIARAVAKFNAGDMRGWVAACDSPASVTDELAPHVWSGPNACADWSRAFQADAKKSGLTKPNVVLQTPWHVDVSGRVAYVVAPANYYYLSYGKPAKELGSYFTFALRKKAAGWMVEAWTWSAVAP